ncbi:MAG TPA: hypothetical protein PLE48_16680 [Thiobacillus sp.]|jgi:hypothetical protein|nr:MAG: hypothetical protein A2X71_04830 [Thiobacillus sp. GWE1_62_9]OJZ04531.1 MAG: hypothetical protein BGP20_12620 [Thiobacillus sp. 63-78]OYW35320.1 MAG: hypothetical protein B7Z35_15555 [Hydrogenophilales bacterium 12-61-10]OYZ55245.1 MAG: hypothetical protein B7Y21_14330 [Hydrogenophilales bacterium 16-61-112]OZA41581.1 MAG: hypothetical protein B7X81_13905 [Hydrogenophilales bacterium 17-61-76]HQT72039.1 hypothetical protein [Thiobacillus sp.]
MTYILLYIAGLIAAMVGVGLLITKLQPRPTPNSQYHGAFDDDAPSVYGLDPSSEFHYGIDHRD